MTRLRLGLAVLVTTTLLGLVAILGTEHQVAEALAGSQQALATLDGFRELQLQVSAARESEQQFRLEDLRTPIFFQQGDSPSLEWHRSAWAEFDRLFGELERQPGASEMGLQEIRQAADRYQEGFEQLVAAYRERGSLYTGRIGEMRQASFEFQDLLAALSERQRAPLRAELLELIRDQADYLRDLDNRPRFLVGERLKILREELDKLGPGKTGTLRARLDDYEAAWTGLLALDDRIGRSSGDGLRGSLREEQEIIVPQTLKAVELARARFDQAAGSVRDAQQTARLANAGAVLLAVAFAIFLAAYLSSQVRRSLGALFQAVEDYARGNRAARVGRLELPDEFARLGRSFDHMAETLAETTDELEEINASLELAIKGDTSGLLERIKQLVRERKSLAC